MSPLLAELQFWYHQICYRRAAEPEGICVRCEPSKSNLTWLVHDTRTHKKIKHAQKQI
jgi:hypothetical protein